jgi:hypothetical protein
VLSDYPITTAQTLVQESAEREGLEQLTDEELLRRASREALMLSPLVPG